MPLEEPRGLWSAKIHVLGVTPCRRTLSNHRITVRGSAPSCLLIIVLGLIFVGIREELVGQDSTPPRVSENRILQPVEPDPEYVLGPEDVLKIWALGMEEISEKPMRVNPGGDLDLPILGRIRAVGLTVERFRQNLLEVLASEVREPKVSIEIVEFGSQPVSVIGAVAHPGVHQLRGKKSLAEVLALAGGLSPDAGSTIKITRQNEWGSIPLPTTKSDQTGNFSVAEVKLAGFLSADNPAENILIRPHDVITVPRGELIYVIGAVHKPGAFPLNEHESVSVLQALSMAEGLGPTPAAQQSKILRVAPGAGERKEIEIDLKKIMAGQAQDVSLQPKDVLFVPDSTSKKAGRRVMEAAIQTLTGVAIWRRP